MSNIIAMIGGYKKFFMGISDKDFKQMTREEIIEMIEKIHHSLMQIKA